MTPAAIKSARSIPRDCPAFRIKATGEIVTLRPAFMDGDRLCPCRHLMRDDYDPLGAVFKPRQVEPLTQAARDVLEVVNG